jgi:hypothetical protein
MPQTDTDPNGRERDNLLQAIAALNEEQERLASLETARERAQEQSWAAASNLREAETSVQRAEAHEGSRLAHAFAAGTDTATISPVTVAESGLTAARAESARIAQIEQALDAELITVGNRRQRAQVAVHAALSDLICNSEQFHHLLAEQTKAWARLRGIRKACALIQHELRGQMPHEFEGKWQAVVTLDPEAVRDSMGPIPTDERPVTAWHDALTNLLQDPDARLPDNV